jgi:hypothetical protein
MILHYFSHVSDIDDLKSAYRALTKKHHPDITGDDGAAMRIINAEYDWILEHGIQNKKTGENFSPDEINLEKEYREVVEKTACLEGLIVELCGSWIWFTGQTYVWKDVLKGLGCFFSSKKSAWYWRPETEQSRNRSKYTLEEIRRIHGRVQIAGQSQLKLKGA